ncbi:MAG TPA: porin [Xanthobacteraceae bacterium]|nr:porin [Xanthobacteraceae bacterium]
MAILALTTGVGSAQTLTDPHFGATPPGRPATVPKAQPSVRANACSAFGAGFVRVPGTDACVKLGGFVTTETGVGR